MTTPSMVTVKSTWAESSTMVTLLINSRSGYQTVHNYIVGLTSGKALEMFNPQACKTEDKIGEHAKVLGISVRNLKALCAFRTDFDKQAIEKSINARASWATMKGCSPEGKQKKAEKNKKAAAKTKGLADIGKGKKKAPKKETEVKADLTDLVGLSLQNARTFISQIMAGVKLHPTSVSNVKILNHLEDACELLAKA
jgi:hypothetical protein